MEAFLGKDFFLGPTVDRSRVRSSILAHSRFDGYIVLAHQQRAEVERLLPPELVLATNTSSTPNLHPVIFIFGEHRDTGVVFGGITIPAIFAWDEFVVAIPFVRQRRGRYLHTYIPRIYSSYFPPTWHGNAHFGYPKQMARMQWQGPILVLTSEDGVLLLHATIESGPNGIEGRQCTLPNFETMREVLALPIIGRKATGEYVCSYFDLDFSDAQVCATDACVAIDAPIIEGLTPRYCHDVESGTFSVRDMLWKLSWPSRCQFR